MDKNQQVVFVWDGPPKNYVKVCIQSLREHNKNCIINFYYTNPLSRFFYKKYNINFIKIDKEKIRNRQLFYKVNLAKDLSYKLDEGTELLVLDLDLLFQDDPFKMFKKYKKKDIFWSCSLMSTPDSLRPEKLWKLVDYKVNSGVWGIRISKDIVKFMNFWVENMLNPTWKKWVNYKYNKSHSINGKINLNWWCDQDFLNCIEENDDILEMFNLKKIDVGYKYNYYTSTWGYFNEELSMRNKIGDKDYKIIHFKGHFKDTFNLNNYRIYNFKNILLKKDLTTMRSRDKIYRRFLKRGDKRFELV